LDASTLATEQADPTRPVRWRRRWGIDRDVYPNNAHRQPVTFRSLARYCTLRRWRTHPAAPRRWSPATPAITAATTARAGGEHDPGPAADPARRDDRAYHLARVCARFPRTISTEGAHRLARLLRVSTQQSP